MIFNTSAFASLYSLKNTNYLNYEFFYLLTKCLNCDFLSALMLNCDFAITKLKASHSNGQHCQPTDFIALLAE